MRILGRGDRYYENLYTYRTLKRMCSGYEEIDYTEAVVRGPDRLAAADAIVPGSEQQKLAIALLRSAYWFSPGYIWLLQKPASASKE